MSLPTIHEVTSMFLYGSETPPSNFADTELTEERVRSPIPVSTDDFLDPETGPGRFVVASNSPLIERFFQSGLAEYAAGAFDGFKDPVTGVVSMSKSQLNGIYDFESFFILVDNKWIYDSYDDYAARTYIYGNISFTISEDARFTIHPDGRIEIENFSLVIHGGADFDWTTRLNDILTTMGNTVLKRAIDPSGIGDTVNLAFTSPTSYTYTQDSYDADVLRAESFSTVLNPLSISQAMGDVIGELYDTGTIRTVMDGKLVLYGSDESDMIGPYISRTGINVSDPGLDLPNPLHEHTGGGLIYVAGAGNDAITGTTEGDVLFGGSGADILIGGAGDDFIFFDAADGINVNGGAGRDVGAAVGLDGVTVNMTAQGLEVCIGSGGADEITCAGSEGALFAAGSGGADTFNVAYDQSEAPKVLWGGAGADSFNFFFGDPENEFDAQLGIAVVRIEGLTEENFAQLSIGDLGLGGVDLSKIDAIIVNPDSADRFYIDGSTLGTSMLNVEDYGVGDYPHFVTGYDISAVSGVLSSSYLGGEHAIQSVYFREVRVETYYTYAYDYNQIDVTATGDVVVTETDFFAETWHDSLQEAIDQALQDSGPWFEENDPYWVARLESDSPAAPFFVVGGAFTGASLSSSGALTAPAPEDPGATPFDWLLVA
jgi:RTX calcium-binding nonapeptide repeat (4 copies)